MDDAEIGGIDACVFDAYGTLFDVHSAAARLGGALGEKRGALSSLWRDKQLEYTWLRSLMGTHADFWQVTGDALDFAMETVGLDDPGLRQDLMDLYLELDAYPEVSEVLTVLKENDVKTAILSNGSPGMLDSAVRSAGIADLLDEVLSIEEVGIYKPHPSVYQLAVDRLGVAAEGICFQSSNAWDVAGAAHFGFRVVWVNRTGQRRERIPGTPDAEVDSLDALPDLIGL